MSIWIRLHFRFSCIFGFHVVLSELRSGIIVSYHHSQPIFASPHEARPEIDIFLCPPRDVIEAVVLAVSTKYATLSASHLPHPHRDLPNRKFLPRRHPTDSPSSPSLYHVRRSQPLPSHFLARWDSLQPRCWNLLLDLNRRRNRVARPCRDRGVGTSDGARLSDDVRRSEYGRGRFPESFRADSPGSSWSATE